MDDAEDLDLVMPMCNLMKYSSNYFEKIEKLWFYLKDEETDIFINIANTDDFKYFKYKSKFLGNTELHPNTNNANGTLKCFSNFWRSLEIPLINSKVELKLKWTKHCVLAGAGNDNANENDNANTTFTIKDKRTIYSCSNIVIKRQPKIIKDS